MRQIKLIIEYDGTNYSGWQVQPNGVTIQQVLEEALAKLLGEQVRLRSSGRTDAGVHARGMVAAFRTEKLLPLQAFSHGVNTLIPPDIAVKSAEEVDPGFDPRNDAVSKHYRYMILPAPVRSPLSRLSAWHFRRPLDLDRMREAGAHFVGEHDFCAFRGYNCSARTTVRTIFSLEVRREEDFIVIDVVGSGFLKNMIRIIVGTLVEVGEGKLSPDDVPAILAGGKRPDAGATAPAQGLCLIEVTYPFSSH
jgi:tRNA pseudouridine38-40 synthase